MKDRHFDNLKIAAATEIATATEVVTAATKLG